MILQTCLTVLNAIESGIAICEWFSGAKLGMAADETLNTRRRDDSEIIKITDRIFIDQSVREVGSSHDSAPLQDPRLIRDLIEPVAEAIGGNVLTSQIIQTPPKLRTAFQEDPWSVLDNVKPARRAIQDPRPDWSPIAFFDDGTEYIGWQKRGALPQLFDCEFVPTDQATPYPKAPEETLESLIVSQRAPLIVTPQIITKALKDSLSGQISDTCFHLTPNIPEAKLRTALSFTFMGRGEKVVAFLDTTIFSSGKIGVIFGDRNLYYRNSAFGSVTSGSLSYSEFTLCDIQRHQGGIRLGTDHSFSPNAVPEEPLMIALLTFQRELRYALGMVQ